ncbi:hypothetical protein CIP107532_01127 [Corynebacterium diphtheriae]|nr:hypothetical protein CIP107524_01081 [Corynebacterium diphtheriae]CAB0561469.1 hypothetical protein CIP107532_01127 [Corynebacterium diphtheriae]CAB0645011.1 hypothetical protein CIP107562_01033 [Corynebacterium diphtheriae]CAB0647706.1 hypothetical protein CIP107571_01171 [Corynebacterium diphtheriae]
MLDSKLHQPQSVWVQCTRKIVGRAGQRDCVLWRLAPSEGAWKTKTAGTCNNEGIFTSPRTEKHPFSRRNRTPGQRPLAHTLTGHFCRPAPSPARQIRCTLVHPSALPTSGCSRSHRNGFSRNVFPRSRGRVATRTLSSYTWSRHQFAVQPALSTGAVGLRALASPSSPT